MNHETVIAVTTTEYHVIKMVLYCHESFFELEWPLKAQSIKLVTLDS
jgi:hypothetical protein